MPTLDSSKLSLKDVHRLLHLKEQLNGSFSTLLTLDSLTEFETQELLQIRKDFRNYLTDAKVSEGLIKFLTVAPLLRLAGFYRYPIKLTMEDSIEIAVEDEEITITGRLDILAVNTEIKTNNIPFWILVIEAKNSAIEVRQGLPQLLTYAFKNLEQQSSVWGMVTNGLQYLFVHLRQETLTYELMPELYLLDAERSIKLLQVLKAICQLQNVSN